jgi:hypothetical protein
MTTRILIRRKDTRVLSETPSSQGNFDTAACADGGAARMRKMTSLKGSTCRDWDNDRSNTPPHYVPVSDRPE